jgi:hypothetical protein
MSIKKYFITAQLFFISFILSAQNIVNPPYECSEVIPYIFNDEHSYLTYFIVQNHPNFDVQFLAADIYLENEQYLIIEKFTIYIIEFNDAEERTYFDVLLYEDLDGLPGAIIGEYQEQLIVESEVVDAFSSNFNIVKYSILMDEPIYIEGEGRFWFDLRPEVEAQEILSWMGIRSEDYIVGLGAAIYYDNNQGQGYSWSIISPPGELFYEIHGECNYLGNHSFDSTSFVVYPNPFSEDIYIHKTNNQNFNIQNVQLFDILGKEVSINLEGNKINTSNLKSQPYFLKISDTSGKVSFFRLIKN